MRISFLYLILCISLGSLLIIDKERSHITNHSIYDGREVQEIKVQTIKG